ncbi:Eukaryotic translation initiation factor 4 gamma 2 [Papilio machaon]|uniref:Eukaryotic translation initiation factor 4 gamma 2 n=1 Tax=Papilio machaon TaxID=76193 RepID=A0A194RFM4_PAPMA|nr:Eukaryotic translation initiation factor 4 gamma 2 [Papilio machaon]
MLHIYLILCWLQVRGILNKLTPEKFQKLSDDLLGLELDSDKVLKGVILLIFEKALDEPKYSSMYAQLCKRLSEEAPNFEPPGQPCTFKLLLLNKCRTEFENRAQGKARAAGALAALADVQMRPAANSLMFTANRLSRPAQHHQPLAAVQQNVLPPTFASAPLLLKEPAITIKPAPDKKDKPKKDKGLSKEEACRLAVEATDALAAAGGAPPPPEDAEPALPAPAAHHVQRLRDLHLPDKVRSECGAVRCARHRRHATRAGAIRGGCVQVLRRVIAAVLEHALTGEPPDAGGAGGGAGGGAEGEEGGAGGEEALASAACAVVRSVKRAGVGEALRALVHAHWPHERLPALLAHATLQRLVTLAEAGAWCEGGQHYPLLLELLQRLQRLAGAERLQRLYNESKINLCAHVSERSGGAAGALEALEARGLAALVPQLRVRAQLARQLASEPAPLALYRWIKANVEPAVRHNGAFVSTLVALVAGHVTAAAGAGGAGAGAGAADKAALEREKALVEAYAPLLTALLEGRPDLQLAAVYAVQVHAHAHRYPKGMLLRWFMYLYNLEVCEEEAFLRWREDVTDAYPGKGEALFQVNTWLTWLQQQESEEEEAED